MSIALHASSSWPEESANTSNPLPTLLQTPSGLALLELQGTINLPGNDDEDTISAESSGVTAVPETPIGRLIFPEYDAKDPGSSAWMKRVYLYVGKHQRLTGEVKKLPKSIAVIRKRVDVARQRKGDEMDGVEDLTDELEIVEIVKYKILFSTRPEPVGALPGGE